MTNDTIVDVFVMGLDSAAIAIVEFQFHSVGDMGINWRFDYHLCYQVAISEQIATELRARESTDGDLGDRGDQLETNQRSISALEDLSTPHDASAA